MVLLRQEKVRRAKANHKDLLESRFFRWLVRRVGWASWLGFFVGILSMEMVEKKSRWICTMLSKSMFCSKYKKYNNPWAGWNLTHLTAKSILFSKGSPFPPPKKKKVWWISMKVGWEAYPFIYTWGRVKNTCFSCSEKLQVPRFQSANFEEYKIGRGRKCAFPDTNIAPEKIDGWKTILSFFGFWPIFQGPNC